MSFQLLLSMIFNVLLCFMNESGGGGRGGKKVTEGVKMAIAAMSFPFLI